MAYTAQMGGTYNAEMSFNDHFRRQLTGAGIPDCLGGLSAVVNFNYPDQPLTFPSFSVSHLGSQPGQSFEGTNLDNGLHGGEQIGIAQIDCWESLQRASGLHPRNLAIMRDMVSRIYATGSFIPMLDVYQNTAYPLQNGTIVRADRVRSTPMLNDRNQDVKRIRMTVTYRWLERVSG